MKVKRLLAALLCLLFCGALMSGCTSYESSMFDSVNQDLIDQGAAAATARATSVPTATQAVPTPTPGIAPYRTPEPTIVATSAPMSAPSAPVAGGGFEGRSDISYVLIYNPSTPLNGHINLLSTGYLGSQVDTTPFSSDGADSETFNLDTVSQDNFQLPDGVILDPENNRPSGAPPVYNKGDTHRFYACVNGNPNVRTERGLLNFTCEYAGDYCYVWVNNNSISTTLADSIGHEFDSVIYPTDVELFGKPRYADEGGKISILIYNAGSDTLGGFFDPYELTDGMSEEEAEENHINLYHAIIHVNSKFVTNAEAKRLYSTAAHELQHLINCTNTRVATNTSNGTWINEAMSGFVEEYIYPGIQRESSRYYSLAQSDLIANGQSLYNFATINMWPYQDIGVYGSVFLFSEYLANLSGSAEVFKNYHTYWRTNADNSMTDAKALYNAVPAGVQSSIISKYSYPSAVRFDNTYDEWLSKLALDFYISMLKYDSGDPEQYSGFDGLFGRNVNIVEYLRYLKPNATDIEAGGRVIIATTDGTFTIPDDASTGLIYIGFDSNLNQVTDLIYH